MTAGNTYTFIGATTVATAASTITFSSIPGTYTDFILTGFARQNAQLDSPYVQMNGDSGANYNENWIVGLNTTVTESLYNGTNGLGMGYGGQGYAPWQEFGANQIHVMGYSDAAKYKSTTSYGGSANSGSGVEYHSTMWKSIAAITSITCKMNTGPWVVGSVIALHGILAA